MKKQSALEEIERKIIKLQKATKSDFPYFVHWHADLCRFSPLYYEWHKNPIAESVHWMVFTLIVLGALMFILKMFVLGLSV